MSDDLERFDPRMSRGRIAYEHFHRYAICRDFVGNSSVLDLACGNGYGSALLAETAQSVIGVDIDAGAIKRASKAYNNQNLSFLCADCYKLPMSANSFDVVVANEMIEHVEDHDGLIEEAKRVLKPGGLFLVSTPNKPVYNRFKAPNTFHVSEMNMDEFKTLINKHFPHARFIGNRMVINSISYPISDNLINKDKGNIHLYAANYTDSGDVIFPNKLISLPDVEYIIAVCSEKVLSDENFKSSIYINENDDLWSEQEKILHWASNLHEEDELLRKDLQKEREENARLISQNQHSIEAAPHTAQLEIATLRDQHHVLARLVGRSNGEAAPSDFAGVIEGMFTLNERMVAQKAQLANLADIAARLEDTQKQLREKTEVSEQAQTHNHSLTAEIERQKADLKMQREHVSATQQKLILLREQHAKKLQHMEGDLADLQTRLAESQNKSQSAIKDAENERRASKVLNASLNFARTHQKVAQSMIDASIFVRRALAVNSLTQPVRGRGRADWLRAFKAAPASFDYAWINEQNPGLETTVSWRRYCRESALFALDPHPLFSAAYYLSQFPSAAGPSFNPLVHYLTVGWRMGLSPHPLFPNDWYLAHNPDVLAAGVNPLEHYLTHGWREDRKANPVFDHRAYLARYPDVAREGVNPLYHYLGYGRTEGREAESALTDLKAIHLLPTEARAAGMMHFLLTNRAPAIPKANGGSDRRSDGTWPPEPLDDYWLPQTLRDQIIDSHGEESIKLYWYLFSVINRHGSNMEEFAESKECAQILDRAKLLANLSHDEGESVNTPTTSIIIPVYNNIVDTLICALSVLEQRAAASLEIIIADDCSTDATQSIMETIGGRIRYLRQTTNKGFLANCNSAAAQARGKYLVLLNNDTIVLPKWLNGLIEPMEASIDIGLVGSKLLNWDGTLQEAGGIVWRDGSAWNFGRNQNAQDPEYNYLKDVDYCSGASIAVPADLWRKLGGFDPVYEPAYSEDSDIAFRIRAEGMRTVYSPASEVVHHEGRSHGKNVASGIKAYQVVNKDKFFTRWQSIMEKENYQNGENVLRARDRSFKKPHILIIDHYVPQHDRDAGSRTMIQFINALLDDGFSITFWPENLYRDPDYTPILQKKGVEVIYGHKFSGNFRSFIKDRGDLYDAVLLSRPHVAINFLSELRELTLAKILFYGHDLHFKRMELSRELGLEISESEVSAMKELEISVCKASDVILYPAETEAAIMAGAVGGNRIFSSIPAYSYSSEMIASSRARSNRPHPRQPAHLFFVGGFGHHPNRDGIIWFVREVFPLLETKGLSVKLCIAGSNPPPEILELAEERIDVLGFVSDEKLAELYSSSDVIIAPLRYGAGVKGKVIEGMAQGVPLVTTSVGAQGIPDAAQCLFIGDDATSFASAIIECLENAPVAAEKSQRALDIIEQSYSLKRIKEVFSKCIVLPAHDAS